MWAVISILVLIIICLSYKLYEHYVAKSLFENIKWCVSYNPNSFSDNIKPEIKMRGYIIHLQTEESLEEQYRIIQSDFDIVNEILKNYQQDLLQRYFRGYAPAYKNLSEEEYFIVTFLEFLQRHQLEDRETNYAVTYHKLSYILQLSSKNIYKRGVKRR